MRSKFSETEFKFQELVREYNKYAKTKYQRSLWRNLRLEEFVHYLSLQETLLSWAYTEGRISENEEQTLMEFLRDKQAANPINKREMKLFKRDDVGEIADALLNGNLVVIPNGQIYVIFGVDDGQSTNRTTVKINREKLRHPLMPVVRLSFLDSIPYESVRDEKVRNFLYRLVEKYNPIGLLLPNRLRGKKSLHVFYGNGFFKQLREQIRKKDKEKTHIYVSSANITTTGANTAAEGVLRDFASSTLIVGVLDEGDLKKRSIYADSSTIIDCSESGDLTYYRIGYPPKEQVERVAKSSGIRIKELPSTRYSRSR